jgi:hypothetical protein
MKKKTIAKPAKQKQYVVMYENTEAWVVGTKQDIIDDFNENPDTYLDADGKLEIYELGEPIKFSFVTPQISF